MRRREILRCAQDDSEGLCHPERSEGSLVRIRLADLTHVALPTYGESPESRGITWIAKVYNASISTLDIGRIIGWMSMLFCPGLTELIREYSLSCISRVDLSWSNC